ncbi:MAG: helix-turn-helix transcriptional regulator [Candidatus Lambdaproteobacteria bacterium]|nr:helix-turn-helix transcriptional regulator [Candidatus Lambdaproteobacteria bacterium]
MTVREVAAYLNIKERKVYDLVHRGRIPCTRVAGKWLFPQHLIDAWVAQGVAAGRGGAQQAAARPAREPPPVVAGSHDPLLEWSLRASACGLAMLPGGSLDGLRRLAAGEAAVCALHLLDPDTGEYNVPAVRVALAGLEVVLLEWARRTQGIVTAPGNPLGLTKVVHLLRKGPRFIGREPASGTAVLLEHLLRQDFIPVGALQYIDETARSQTDVGMAILEGRADAGLAVEAVARQLQLGFVPLVAERVDLALLRRDYFEPPMQRLLAFTRTPPFRDRAAALGYDISEQGKVHYNGA